MLLESYLSHHCYDPENLPLPPDVQLIARVGRAVVYQCRAVNYLAVRGSASPSDWLANAFAAKAPIHSPRGSLYGHAGHVLMARRLAAELRHWRLATKAPLWPHWFYCGHSAGGSVALAVAAIEAAKTPPRIVTFGQPRFSTATEIWRMIGNAQYIRVVNGSDAVPRAPWPLGFSHCGELRYFTNEGKLVPDAGAWTRFVDRLEHPLFERLTDHSAELYFHTIWRHYYGRHTDPATFLTR